MKQIHVKLVYDYVAYSDYCNSEHWIKVRADIIEVRGRYCEDCKEHVPEKQPLTCHHITYKNLFDEQPEDLRLLCDSCHTATHSDSRNRYYPKDEHLLEKAFPDKAKLGDDGSYKMAFWVYILECYKNGEFSCYYTGHTQDFHNRMGEHFRNVRNRNTTTIAGRFDAVKPVWKWRVDTREEAMRLKREIEVLTPNEQRDLMSGRLNVKLKVRDLMSNTHYAF